MRHHSLLLILVFMLSAAAATANSLKSAEEAYRSLDYDACIDNAEGALAERATLEERTNAFMYLGLCQAALSQSEEARDAFISMLAISPKKKLPPGLSPRFTSTYLEAKGEWLGKTPMTMNVELLEEKAQTLRVEIAFEDVASLGAKIAYREIDGELSEPFRLAERMELNLPNETALELVVLDDRGGEVFVQNYGKANDKTTAEGSDTKLGEGASEVSKDEESESSSLWIWGATGAAAVVVVSGVVAGVLLFPQSATLETSVSIAPSTN